MRFSPLASLSADEAMRLLELPSSKLFPVLLGRDFHQSSFESLPVEFAIPDEFFLFVGSLEPGRISPSFRLVYLEAEKSGKPLPPLIVVGVRWEGVSKEESGRIIGFTRAHWSILNLSRFTEGLCALVFPSEIRRIWASTTGSNEPRLPCYLLCRWPVCRKS